MRGHYAVRKRIRYNLIIELNKNYNQLLQMCLISLNMWKLDVNDGKITFGYMEASIRIARSL